VFLQRGMYAMIAVSIAMALWTAALSYSTAKLEKKRKAEFGVVGGRPGVDHKIVDDVEVEGTTSTQAPAKVG